MNKSDAYEGAHVLELLEDAKNYNTYLVNLLEASSKPGDRVLDFGAGIGTFAKILSDNGRDVICVEPDVLQNAVLQEKGLSAHKDLAEIPENQLDLIYSLNVLEHIEDDIAVLRLCRARIKPGGRILIYVPAFQVLYSSFDRMLGHVRRYSRAELSAKVSGAGFLIEQVCYADSLGFFAAAVFKIFGREDGNFSKKMLVLYDRLFFPLSRLLDLLLSPFLGKNLLVVARRDQL
jgi:SAM-dependent methyltransferase